AAALAAFAFCALAGGVGGGAGVGVAGQAGRGLVEGGRAVVGRGVGGVGLPPGAEGVAVLGGAVAALQAQEPALGGVGVGVVGGVCAGVSGGRTGGGGAVGVARRFGHRAHAMGVPAPSWPCNNVSALHSPSSRRRVDR